MTGGDLFVECLKAQGVSVIFGLPGNHLDTVYESLYNNQDSIAALCHTTRRRCGIYGGWLRTRNR